MTKTSSAWKTYNGPKHSTFWGSTPIQRKKSSANRKPFHSVPLTRFCTRRAFVTGPGDYRDYGGIAVERGDDPNAQDFDLDWPSCYRNIEHDLEALFPFHWCCYEILAKCLTGSFDDGGLDKDLPYSIMNELSPDSGGGMSLLHVDYGDAGRIQHQFWETEAVYEFLVGHPRNAPGVR